MQIKRKAQIKKPPMAFRSNPSSRYNQLLKSLLGGDESTLANEARGIYPQEPRGSAHHRLAAQRLTSLLRQAPFPGSDIAAVALPQLGGLGVEALEAAGRYVGGAPVFDQKQREDTWNDLKANWSGSMDALE